MIYFPFINVIIVTGITVMIVSPLIMKYDINTKTVIVLSTTISLVCTTLFLIRGYEPDHIKDIPVIEQPSPEWNENVGWEKEAW